MDVIDLENNTVGVSTPICLIPLNFSVNLYKSLWHTSLYNGDVSPRTGFYFWGNLHSK